MPSNLKEPRVNCEHISSQETEENIVTQWNLMEPRLYFDKVGLNRRQVPLQHSQLLWNPVSIETQGRSWNYKERCEAMEPRINSDREASWNTRDTEILPGLVEPRHHVAEQGLMGSERAL